MIGDPYWVAKCMASVRSHCAVIGLSNWHTDMCAQMTRLALEDGKSEAAAIGMAKQHAEMVWRNSTASDG